jgi:hypothetical protein
VGLRFPIKVNEMVFVFVLPKLLVNTALTIIEVNGSAELIFMIPPTILNPFNCEVKVAFKVFEKGSIVATSYNIEQVVWIELPELIFVDVKEAFAPERIIFWLIPNVNDGTGIGESGEGKIFWAERLSRETESYIEFCFILIVSIIGWIVGLVPIVMLRVSDSTIVQVAAFPNALRVLDSSMSLHCDPFKLMSLLYSIEISLHPLLYEELITVGSGYPIKSNDTVSITIWPK